MVGERKQDADINLGFIHRGDLTLPCCSKHATKARVTRGMDIGSLIKFGKY